MSGWSAIVAPAVFHNLEESEAVAEYFGGRPGTFVEVGAFDPVDISQTCHLERAGWSGIMIEPVAEFAERIRVARKAPVFEVACGPPERDGTSMPIRIAGPFTSMQTTWVRPELLAPTVEVRQVPVKTLDRILSEAGIARIDFLSIDVEGFELDVLRGLSLDRFRPSLVLLEDDLYGLAVHRHMLANGYKLVRRTGVNSWYVPTTTPFPVSLFGHWQLFRKYYLGVPLRWLKRKSQRRPVAPSPTAP